ncbi:MAG: hypothetical protein ACK56I_21875, partial [bacterium]
AGARDRVHEHEPIARDRGARQVARRRGEELVDVGERAFADVRYAPVGDIRVAPRELVARAHEDDREPVARELAAPEGLDDGEIRGRDLVHGVSGAVLLGERVA